MRRHQPPKRPERAGRARHPRQLPRALPRRRTRVRGPVAGARRDRVDRDRPRPPTRPGRALGRQQLRLLRRTDAVQHPRRTALDLGPLRASTATTTAPRTSTTPQTPSPRPPTTSANYCAAPTATSARRSSATTTHRPTSTTSSRAPAGTPAKPSTNSRTTDAAVGCSGGGLDVPVGPANLRHVERLTAPRAFRAVPAWAMAAGRAPQLVDARIHGNVVWILRRYHLHVTAARESGHQTHGDGTAIDLVPADGTTQPVWDASAGRLAQDLGWTTGCANVRHPPRLPARTRDPVHRLRRLPQPRLAPHLHRHLPRPPPHLLGLRLLWLKHALAPLRLGRRLPTAAGRRRRRERSAAMSSRFSRSYVPVRAPSRASGRSIEPPRHWRGRLARWRPRDLLRWGVIVTPAARDDASDAEAWRASSPHPG